MFIMQQKFMICNRQALERSISTGCKIILIEKHIYICIRNVRDKPGIKFLRRESSKY